MNCPCQSGRLYGQCCEPLHQGAAAPDAEALMRSRYCAYVLGNIDYLVASTVPAQQPLLDTSAMHEWSETAEWEGLQVWEHQAATGKRHARVCFTARFREQGQSCEHREHSAFVNIKGRWYFIDPTVPLPAPREDCICGSRRNFKSCCGGAMAE